MRLRSTILITALWAFYPAASNAGSITPYGVNDSGMIVGEYYNGTTSVAVVYNPATNTYSYPAVNLAGVTSSAFVGINDSGVISGSYTTSSGNYGFIDNAGTFTSVSAPGAVQSTQGFYLFGSGGTVVSGINDAGAFVGEVTTRSGVPGFIDSGGVFSNFSDPSAVITGPYGINDSGIISGTAIFVSGGVSTHVGFLYNTNTSTFTPIVYPGATNTIVQGINDSGEVVGFYTLVGQTSGFIYESGTYLSVMYPGSNLTELFGISNNGEITGLYTCASGPCASDPAFYATPTQSGYVFTTLPNPTPEPGTFALLGCGFVALGVAWRKGRRRHDDLRQAIKPLASVVVR